jgi:hypothetical protein
LGGTRWSSSSSVEPAAVALSVGDRRALVAHLLALPASLRPSLESASAWLGVSTDTLERDAARDDVRSTAEGLGAVGLAVLLAQVVPATVTALALRSGRGDLPATRELRGWAESLGLFDALKREHAGGVLGAVADLKVCGSGAGTLLTDEARAELSAVVRARSLTSVDPDADVDVD